MIKTLTEPLFITQFSITATKIRGFVFYPPMKILSGSSWVIVSLQIFCGTPSHVGFSRTCKSTLFSSALYDHLLPIHHLNHFCASKSGFCCLLFVLEPQETHLSSKSLISFQSNFKYVNLELLWFYFFFLWFQYIVIFTCYLNNPKGLYTMKYEIIY